MINTALRSLGRLLCVVVGTLALTIAPIASFADEEPSPPGDFASTGGDSEGEDEGEGDGEGEGEGDESGGDGAGAGGVDSETEGGNEVVTGEPPAGAAGEVEAGDGADVLIVDGGAISVGGAAGAIKGDEGGPAIGVLTVAADESGDVALQVRRYVEEENVVSSKATIFVNVVVASHAGGKNADDDSAEVAVDAFAAAALPEAGAAGSLRPALAAGIYFTLAGLVVVAATRRHDIFVPAHSARRLRVNWE